MERAEKGSASADVCVMKNPLADVVSGVLGLQATFFYSSTTAQPLLR